MNFNLFDWVYMTTAFSALVFFGTILGLVAGFTPLAATLLAAMTGGALVVSVFIVVMWLHYFAEAWQERKKQPKGYISFKNK